MSRLRNHPVYNRHVALEKYFQRIQDEVLHAAWERECLRIKRYNLILLMLVLTSVGFSILKALKYI